MHCTVEHFSKLIVLWSKIEIRNIQILKNGISIIVSVYHINLTLLKFCKNRINKVIDETIYINTQIPKQIKLIVRLKKLKIKID